ncbi:MAG: hypothetical protein ACYC35_01630 [Pirellulales bacterium]
MSELPAPDPDLEAVIDAWPSLPQDVRERVAGIIREAVEGVAP